MLRSTCSHVCTAKLCLCYIFGLKKTPAVVNLFSLPLVMLLYGSFNFCSLLNSVDSLWFTGGPTPLTGVSSADHISKMLSSLDSLHQFFHPPFSLFPTVPPRCTHKAQCWDCLTYPISLYLCWKFINSQERSRDEVPSQRYGKLKPMSARE